MLAKSFVWLSAIMMLDGICGKMQYVTVNGQIGCNDKSVSKAKIELKEHDAIGVDDTLNSTSSDSSGRFHLFGQENELLAIEPYVRIIHNCDGGKINPVCSCFC
ncbi:unnamed protein product [Toxocara canis]|uniref:Transthyretin-like family protein n=1 Tax=Toxocara canis TaxID=6265 RepID=A0A183UUC3_TOXCA|nr:unnamed protein product [Toxocara canis]